jgi:hypothetical protein
LFHDAPPNQRIYVLQSSKDGKRTQVWSTTHFGNDHSKSIKPTVDQLDKFIKDHVRMEVANHGAEL